MKGDSTGGKRQVADSLRQTNSARERGPSLDTLDSLVGGDGPPFCMDCVGTGQLYLLIFQWPYHKLVMCDTCGGTGRAKDHPANSSITETVTP